MILVINNLNIVVFFYLDMFILKYVISRLTLKFMIPFLLQFVSFLS